MLISESRIATPKPPHNSTPHHPPHPTTNPIHTSVGPPCFINPHRVTRPAGRNLTVVGDAVKKQLDGIGAGHAAYTGESVGVAGYGEAAVVQAFGDLGVGFCMGAVLLFEVFHSVLQ